MRPSSAVPFAQSEQQQQQHFQRPPARIVYNDLACFPKTSNYGSMKKKSKREQTQQQQLLLQRLQQQQQQEQQPPSPPRRGSLAESLSAHNGIYS